MKAAPQCGHVVASDGTATQHSPQTAGTSPTDVVTSRPRRYVHRGASTSDSFTRETVAGRETNPLTACPSKLYDRVMENMSDATTAAWVYTCGTKRCREYSREQTHSMSPAEVRACTGRFLSCNRCGQPLRFVRMSAPLASAQASK